MGFLGFGALAALLWYTGHQVIDGSLGIGTLTGFLLYGVAIAASLGTIAGIYGQFREGTGAITRVFEIIDTRPTIVDAPGAQPICHRSPAGSSSTPCRSHTFRATRCCATSRSPSGQGRPSPWSARRDRARPP